ncbi:HAMP domain-containing histidine kinase [bacterium]|nr:HAMP domain-containing histidine kinase [bacterium]MCB9479467.1 HAMP domain-containing histidine kinase [Deltaproteobacteria bacterium]
MSAVPPGPRPKYRPRVRTVLLVVNLMILALPLGGIAALRLYETELIQRTEAELLGQGAVLADVYRREFLQRLPKNVDRQSFLDGYGRPLDPDAAPESIGERRYTPVFPTLDVAENPILPPAEPAERPPAPPISTAVIAGKAVTPTLMATQRLMLDGIRVVDVNGTVVATTSGESGLSLARREEVARALRGEYARRMRRRFTDHPQPALDSISRRKRVRVYVAMPVIARDRVIGAVVLARTPLDVTKALYVHRWPLLKGFGILLALVLLVAALTSRTISRPVAKLIAQSERARRGERGSVVPLDHAGTREVAQLSAAFSQMAASLEERADYIRDFAARVSHEFKTPLTAIRGAVEIMQDHFETMTVEEQRRFLSNLDKDAERLDHLVRRLLEQARADVVRPGTGNAAIVPATRQIARTFTDLKMEITESISETTHVRMDEENFATVLRNLLENVVRHAGAGANVRVTLSRVEVGQTAYVRLEINDDGPGVSKRNADRAFAPFFTTARDTGGTGLGLSIVRSLVIGHQGRIELTHPERGFGIRVDLPYVEGSG